MKKYILIWFVLIIKPYFLYILLFTAFPINYILAISKLFMNVMLNIKIVHIYDYIKYWYIYIYLYISMLCYNFVFTSNICWLFYEGVVLNYCFYPWDFINEILYIQMHLNSLVIYKNYYIYSNAFIKFFVTYWLLNVFIKITQIVLRNCICVSLDFLKKKERLEFQKSLKNNMENEFWE